MQFEAIFNELFHSNPDKLGRKVLTLLQIDRHKKIQPKKKIQALPKKRENSRPKR